MTPQRDQKASLAVIIAASEQHKRLFWARTRRGSTINTNGTIADGNSTGQKMIHNLDTSCLRWVGEDGDSAIAFDFKNNANRDNLNRNKATIFPDTGSR